MNLSYIRRSLDMALSEGRGKQLFWLIAIIFIFFILFWGISSWLFPSKDLDWQGVLTLLLDPGSFGDTRGNHDLFRLIISLIGLFLFSALLISVVSNIFENTADSFKKGYSRYRHSGHVLILGAETRLQAMISALLDEEEKRQVVVVTNTDVENLRAKLLSSLSDDNRRAFRKRITLYHGERDNKDILRKWGLAKNARSIYIIGENDELNHDAISIHCYDILTHDISFKKTKTKQSVDCVLVLEDPASYEACVHKRQPLDGDDGVLNTELIYANEQIAEQVLIPSRSPEGNPYPFIDYRSISRIENGFNCVPGITKDCDKYVHLIIAGTTDLAVAMAWTAANICHFPNFKEGKNRTVISFIGKGMWEHMSRLASSYENIFMLSHYRYVSFPKEGSPSVRYFAPDEKYGDFLDIEWEFIEGSISSHEVSSLLKDATSDEAQALSIVICMESQKENTFAATHLPADVYQKGIPIFVHQQNESILSQHEHAGTHGISQYYGNLHLFGMVSANQSDPLFRHRLAKGRLVHWGYAQQYSNSQNEDDEWKEMNADVKISSIYLANALPTLARGFGLGDYDLTKLNETDFEIFDEVNHRRLVMSNLILGWHPLEKAVRDDLITRIYDSQEAEERMEARRQKKYYRANHYLFLITPYESRLMHDNAFLIELSPKLADLV